MESSSVRVSWFLIWLLISIGSVIPDCFSQDSLLHGFEKTIVIAREDPEYSDWINRYAEVLKTEKRVSPDSIHLHAEDFSGIGEAFAYYVGYDDRHYWYRFKIQNRDSIPLKFLLLVAEMGIRDSEMFLVSENGDLKSLVKTGYRYPLRERSTAHSRYFYPIEVPAKTTSCFYLNLDNSHAFKMSALALFHPRALDELITRYYFFFGIFMGVLGLFAVFNVSLFITTRDRIHLWYTLYLICQMYFLLKQEGLDAVFLGLDSETGYRAFPMMSASALSIALLLHVVTLFLTNLKADSWPRKFAILIKTLLIVTIVAFNVAFIVEPGHVIETITFQLISKTTLFACISIVGIALYSYFQGYKPAMLIVAGVSLYLLSGAYTLLFLPQSSFITPPNLIQAGIILETIIISFGIMYQYNVDKKERIRLAKEVDANTLLQRKLEEQLNEAQLTAAKAQMNPHFVFNAISSIQNLILKENKQDALIYLNDFSKITRLTLENASKESITLKEEIQFLEHYLQLEQLRHGKVSYAIIHDEVDDISYERIPPMLVQPFVENSIKHGLVAKRVNGHVEIRFKLRGEDLVCTVTDNGVGRKAASEVNHAGHNSMSTKITDARMELMRKKAELRKKYNITIHDLSNEKGGASGTMVEITIPTTISISKHDQHIDS